jgi:hypothetical protein
MAFQNPTVGRIDRTAKPDSDSLNDVPADEIRTRSLNLRKDARRAPPWVDFQPGQLH